MIVPIYTPWPTEVHEWVVAADGEGRITMDGRRRLAQWVPPRVELVTTTEDGRSRAYADFPYWGTDALACSEGARAELAAVIGDAGEFLPLDCPERELWLLNVTLAMDILDRDESGISRLTTGRVFEIAPVVIRSDNILPPLFRLPAEFGNDVYLTDEFFDYVASRPLVGLGRQAVGHAVVASQ